MKIKESEYILGFTCITEGKGLRDGEVVDQKVATIYTGKKITELSDINEVSHLEELGLQDRLSVNRRNGFAAMIDKIRRIQ